jgi:maltose O-acetyltransferase
MSSGTDRQPLVTGPEVHQRAVRDPAAPDPGDFHPRPRSRPSYRALYRTALNRVRGYPSVRWLVKRGLRLGRDVYIGDFVHFDHGFLWLISVGDESVIASDTRILAHDGSTKHWTDRIRVGRVDIGRRVYIGAGSLVLPGVRIGDDSIVGAGSVVTRDVPERTVAAGNPAMPIASLDDFVAKHQARTESRPCYPRPGFSAYEYVTAENAQRMRDELADGPGYVD